MISYESIILKGFSFQIIIKWEHIYQPESLLLLRHVILLFPHPIFVVHNQPSEIPLQLKESWQPISGLLLRINYIISKWIFRQVVICMLHRQYNSLHGKSEWMIDRCFNGTWVILHYIMTKIS